MSLPKFSKQLELVSTVKTKIDLSEILDSHKKQIEDITHLEFTDSVLKIKFTDKSKIVEKLCFHNQHKSESVFVFGAADNIRCTENHSWLNRDHVNAELHLEAAKHDKFHEDRFYREYEDDSDFTNWLIDNYRYDEYLYFDIDTRHFHLKSDHAFNDELHKTKTPIYAYIHGGITISTKPFSCSWDSGVIGYVYHDFSEADIDSTISDINDYLTGDVWFDRYEDDCLISDTYKRKLEADLEVEAKKNAAAYRTEFEATVLNKGGGAK